MRILITGICGFVGSTLARGLREGWPDWEIVGLDNFVRAGSETNRRALRETRRQALPRRRPQPQRPGALPRCDWIIEAAANPSVLAGVDGKTSSRQLIEHNLVGTINMLELRSSGAAASPSSAPAASIRFAPSRPFPWRPGRPVRPVAAECAAHPAASAPRAWRRISRRSLRCPFTAASKRASELLACEYAESFNLPVSILRCGVLAGAGQFGKIDQGIFSYWIHSWRRKRPLKYIGFNGTGLQVRDCLHARDLLPLVAQQIQSPRPDAPRVLNVSGGSSQSASLRQLSAWCAERFGPHPVAAEAKDRPFDVPWLVLDSSLAAQTWGWKPQTPLEAIWTEIAEHAEKNPDWLDATAD